jgi:adenine-specific DNA glycosylase
LIIGTSKGEVYSLVYNGKENEFVSKKIYGKCPNIDFISTHFNKTLTKSVLGRRDDMVFTVNHINDSNILIFYNSGDLKHIQIDNNNLKTLGKINKSQTHNIKRIFGRMFKLNSSRDTVYWKKSNNEIVKQSLFGK